MGQTSEEVVRDILQFASERAKNPGTIWGMPWGLPSLDDLTGGIHEGQLTVVGARPGVGKTTFAAQVATNVAQYLLETGSDLKVRYLVGEGSSKSIAQRIIFALDAQEVQRLHRADPERPMKALSERRMRHGTMSSDEKKRFVAAAHRAAQLPIVWEDRLESPEATRRMLEAKGGDGTAFWVMDYLSKHPTGRPDMLGEDTRGVSFLSDYFRRIAEDIAPGLLLSALNRDIDKRPDHTPTLSDFFGSSALEHAGHTMAILHRPDMYESTEERKAQRRKTLLTQAHIVKNRTGEQLVLQLLFSPANWAFTDITEIETEEAAA